MITKRIREIVESFCDKHGRVCDHSHPETCPYCDLCEHGAARTMHCDKCNPNPIPPDHGTRYLSERELRELELEQYPFRRLPHVPRCYVSCDVPLPALAVAEIRALRAELAKVQL